MILATSHIAHLHEILDKIGLGVALKKSSSALIKINLTRPPQPGHPRTDAALMERVIRYCTANGACCAIAEGANGFLQENVRYVGLEQVVKENDVKVIDLDLEDFERVIVDDEEHYLPKCLKEYAIRIAVPALSKRPEMIFSNHVKLFVGAVPRRMYQIGEATSWRPRVHIDLHRSVANIYRAIMDYAPFHFFINGGQAMMEGQGEMEMQEILIGDNALELDLFFLKRFSLEAPEYINRLVKLGSTVSEVITEHAGLLFMTMDE